MICSCSMLLGDFRLSHRSPSCRALLVPSKRRGEWQKPGRGPANRLHVKLCLASRLEENQSWNRLTGNDLSVRSAEIVAVRRQLATWEGNDKHGHFAWCRAETTLAAYPFRA